MRKKIFIQTMAVLTMFFSSSVLLTSCKENIDESNLYTFTGETIEDFLANRSDEFSSSTTFSPASAMTRSFLLTACIPASLPTTMH